MPSARTEVAVAEVDGKIYVVGGFGGERELEVYDPGTDRCMQVAEERRVLCVDLICIHGHDGDVIVFALDPPRHGDTPSRFVTAQLMREPKLCSQLWNVKAWFRSKLILQHE